MIDGNIHFADNPDDIRCGIPVKTLCGISVPLK